jgi:hypothetical protein
MIKRLTALAGVLLIALFIAPPWLAAGRAGAALADPARLAAAFRSAYVGYWRSGDRDLPPDLARLVDYWIRFHVIKAAIGAILLAVLVVLIVRLWREFLARDRRAAWPAVGAVFASVAALFSLLVVMANAQGIAAPLSSLSPMLVGGPVDGPLASTLTQIRQTMTGSQTTPVLQQLISDFGVYHAAMAVISAIVILALAGLSVVLWRGFAAAGRRDRRARLVWGSYGTFAVVFLLLMSVVLTANVGVAAHPAPALAAFFNGSW